jgi:hypothetical protein
MFTNTNKKRRGLTAVRLHLWGGSVLCTQDT